MERLEQWPHFGWYVVDDVAIIMVQGSGFREVQRV